MRIFTTVFPSFAGGMTLLQSVDGFLGIRSSMPSFPAQFLHEFLYMALGGFLCYLALDTTGRLNKTGAQQSVERGVVAR